MIRTSKKHQRQRSPYTQKREGLGHDSLRQTNGSLDHGLKWFRLSSKPPAILQQIASVLRRRGSGQNWVPPPCGEAISWSWRPAHPAWTLCPSWSSHKPLELHRHRHQSCWTLQPALPCQVLASAVQKRAGCPGGRNVFKIYVSGN